jgi:hypothetical protein
MYINMYKNDAQRMLDIIEHTCMYIHICIHIYVCTNKYGYK